MSFISDLVNLDAFVQTEKTHIDLCKALRLANENQSYLKLRINKLDLVNLGVPRISVLLDLIDPEVSLICNTARKKTSTKIFYIIF